MREKELLVCRLNEIIDQRIGEAKSALEAAKESRDGETKSSVGDKYETGRAMVQMEMEKYQDQMDKSLKLKRAVAQIDLSKKSEKVEYGSLVITDQGRYLISVGLGILEANGERYFTISLASPIGKALEGKEVDEKATFQGREFKVLSIQ